MVTRAALVLGVLALERRAVEPARRQAVQRIAHDVRKRTAQPGAQRNVEAALLAVEQVRRARRERNASRNACLPRPPLTFSAAGRFTKRSTKRWSSSGGRSSSEFAIDARSDFTRIWSGRNVWKSAYCAR